MLGLGLGLPQYLMRRRVTDPLRALIAQLYGNGEQGAMYVPQPQVLGQQVLYQDAAGTVPVTADGDQVGYMADLSGNGNHATQSIREARPIYRTDGVLHWLEQDLVDDAITFQLPDMGANGCVALATSAGAAITNKTVISGSITLTGHAKFYGGIYRDSPITDDVSTIAYLDSLSPGKVQGVLGAATPIVMDGTDGWYGETSDGLLGYELAALLNVTEGVAQHDDAGLLKFASQGKTLLTAKRPFRRSISWDHLYSRGIVYGTDDNGANPRGTPVNQRTTVKLGGNEYIVRLMTCAHADPFAESDPLFFTADMYQGDFGVDSEWNRLIYRVHNAVPSDPAVDGMRADRHGGPQVGENWASYTDSALGIVGNGRACWGQEMSDTTSPARVARGYDDVASFFRLSAFYAARAYGWRPVLELITDGGAA